MIDGIAKRLQSAPTRERAAAGLDLWLLGREDDSLEGTLYGELVCGRRLVMHRISISPKSVACTTCYRRLPALGLRRRRMT
ncbi:hypothetical protein GCM10025858_22300 [Alicyclobacillus sacchari]|nr:hypothetical protein GCM10025858_22300 [Alicyclobacillus sacchari]